MRSLASGTNPSLVSRRLWTIGKNSWTFEHRPSPVRRLASVVGSRMQPFGVTSATVKGTAILRTLSRRRLAAGLAMLGLSGGAVMAHHGVTGRYDTGTPIALTGTVTRATFSPPHPVISVQAEAAEPPAIEGNPPDKFTGPAVARAEDVGQVHEIEFSPARTFYRLADRVRVGDRVTVLALRNCLPPNQLRSWWIRLSDGEVVSLSGDWARGVDGCS